MEKILSFFIDNNTPYFALESGTDTIARNVGENALDDHSAAQSMLEKAITYIQPGSKVTLKVFPNKKNYSGQLVFNTYNTPTGEAPSKMPTITPSMMQIGNGVGGSWLDGYRLGLMEGREQGLKEAELSQVKNSLNELKEQAQGGGGGILENLTATESGQMILLAISKKLGLDIM